MKSLKDLLNDYARSSSYRKVSDAELAALKKCVLDIYCRVAEVCSKNNLTIMLGGGSVLGAVRHQGFIPWDDDMDLNMFRDDYDKLIKLCENGALGDNYEFTYPNRKHDTPNGFFKIYRKDSVFVDYSGELEKYPMGVFIDIFPIEYAPNSAFARKCKGFIANSIRLIGNMVRDTEKLQLVKKNASIRSKLYWNVYVRCILGNFFSIISHKRWILMFDSFVRRKKSSDFLVVPTGRRLYTGEIYPYSVFFPVKKGYFEGLEITLPANTDYYLKNMFGNYMEIPPVEKRESHMISELHIPEEFFLS